MAKLTAAQRNALPASQFAGPNRTYPVNDPAHAAAAKSRAAQNASPAVQKQVDAKANKVLGNSGPSTSSPPPASTASTPSKKGKLPPGLAAYEAKKKAGLDVSTKGKAKRDALNRMAAKK